MKTAIIGLGILGSRVANNLVAGGESVISRREIRRRHRRSPRSSAARPRQC
jgi:Trk K+ transport system NAD-binding subunit